MDEISRCPVPTIYPGARVTGMSSIHPTCVIGESSWVDGCSLAEAVRINRRNVLVDCSVGKRSYTGPNTVIKHAEIGNYCSISWNCSISGSFHDPSLMSTHPFTRLSSYGFIESNLGVEDDPVRIGNDVWIGMSACILPGVTVGDGAIVGAGSVVTKNVPPFAIVAGNPAKLIRMRFSSDEVALLTELAWWEWPDDWISRYMDYFSEPVTREALFILKNLVERHVTSEGS